MGIHISVPRGELPDKRLAAANENPARRGALEPLDDRLECPLGRLAATGKITTAEYEAGKRWQKVYIGYLRSIGAPSPFPSAVNYEYDEQIANLPPEMSDEDCEFFAKEHRRGVEALMAQGRRVFHAVNAIAVYEEPETLGDFEFTCRAAKVGLAALAGLNN